MPNGMRWVGLDVHAHASTLAVFDDATGEVITRRVNGRPIETLDVLRELPQVVARARASSIQTRGEPGRTARHPCGREFAGR